MDAGLEALERGRFLGTPNPGGVYKVWATKVADYLAGCAALGVPAGLSAVDCGSASGNQHGFVPSDSKTDNFKVKAQVIIEIDTRFFDNSNGGLLFGRMVKWTDTLGGSNIKWSHYDEVQQVAKEAHVEAVETGLHLITVADQPGCKVHQVLYGGKFTSGPRTVQVRVNNEKKEETIRIDVYCE
jgi:hypothetical protein